MAEPSISAANVASLRRELAVVEARAAELRRILTALPGRLDRRAVDCVEQTIADIRETPDNVAKHIYRLVSQIREAQKADLTAMTEQRDAALKDSEALDRLYERTKQFVPDAHHPEDIFRCCEALHTDLAASQARECAARAALQPFRRFAATRIEIFGSESRNGFLEAHICAGKYSASLLRCDWEALLALCSPAPCPHQKRAEELAALAVATEEWFWKYSGRPPGCPEPPQPPGSEDAREVLATRDARIAAEKDKRIAELEAKYADVTATWTDDKGTVWTVPTAWAYAQACRAVDTLRKSLAEAKAEARRKALALIEASRPFVQAWDEYVRAGGPEGKADAEPLLRSDAEFKALSGGWHALTQKEGSAKP